MDVVDCERLISRKTKAIMPVHIYGFATNMDDVMSFAKKHNLLVIEDAAQALAVKWGGKNCGSFGDVATFSFFADKTITTGEGGFVCTNNKETYEKLLYLRNQGRIDRGSFIHPKIGYNFRMTDIQMAIGLTQLKKLDYIIARKRKIYNLYKDLLSDVDDVQILAPHKKVDPYIPFRVSLLTKEKSKKLMNFMSDNGIETRTFFYPLHKQPCFKSLLNYGAMVKKSIPTYAGPWYQEPGFEHPPEEGDSLKNSIYVYEHGICLPSYVALKEEQIKYVCSKIKGYYEKAQS